jgi:hypothetical protein
MKNFSGDIYSLDLIKDLLFLDAWEKGFVPWSTAASVVFRVRQLRRANPALKLALNEDQARNREDHGP